MGIDPTGVGREAASPGTCHDATRAAILGSGIGNRRKTAPSLPSRGRLGHVMIRRRAAAAGIATLVGNHTFRATGITTFLKTGGTLEGAAAMANHASTATTQLYD